MLGCWQILMSGRGYTFDRLCTLNHEFGKCSPLYVYHSSPATQVCGFQLDMDTMLGTGVAHAA